MARPARLMTSDFGGQLTPAVTYLDKYMRADEQVGRLGLLSALDKSQ